MISLKLAVIHCGVTVVMQSGVKKWEHSVIIRPIEFARRTTSNEYELILNEMFRKYIFLIL